MSSKSKAGQPSQPEPPYHKGPPPIGSVWSNSVETRQVVGIVQGRGIAYLVRYRLSRGWPPQEFGETACVGDEWTRWCSRSRRTDKTSNTNEAEGG